MESTQSKNKALFTFRVGPDKQVFQVNQNIVSRASPVLDRMISNGMKESEEKVADLPDVDPATFLSFSQYAQNLWHSDNVVRARKSKGFYPGYGTSIVKMIDNGFHTFMCLGCRHTVLLPYCSTFPYCEDCGDGDIHIHNEYENHCVLCDSSKGVSCCSRTVCKKCYCKCGVGRLDGYDSFKASNDASKELGPCIEEAERIEVFRFDIPILATDNMASLPWVMVSPKMFADPEAIVKQWKFANMYNVSEFGSMAVIALFDSLAMEEHTTDAVISLAEYIYSGTPDTGFEETEFGKRNVLRRLIASYIVYHGADLQSSPAFGGLMCSSREVALDVHMASTKIRAGNIGKGW